MAKLGLTMYLDSESSSTVDCRGGWLRFAILCSTTTSVTLYARTFVKGLGRWTTSPTAFSSKHQLSSIKYSSLADRMSDKRTIFRTSPKQQNGLSPGLSPSKILFPHSFARSTLRSSFLRRTKPLAESLSSSAPSLSLPVIPSRRTLLCALYRCTG